MSTTDEIISGCQQDLRFPWATSAAARLREQQTEIAVLRSEVDALGVGQTVRIIELETELERVLAHAAAMDAAADAEKAVTARVRRVADDLAAQLRAHRWPTMTKRGHFQDFQSADAAADAALAAYEAVRE